MKEFFCIDRYFTPLTQGVGGALGLKDDAALVDLGGDHDLVVSSDVCVEGIHFFSHTSPDSVARRCLRVNLSDLAAMGAIPLGYTQTLALPPGLTETWIQHYACGLKEDQAFFNIHLLGGDTVFSPGPLSISMTVFGRVKKKAALKRSGALRGDRLYVTGPIGDAYLGRKLLQGDFREISSKSRDYLTGRYTLPSPRLKEADHLSSYVNAGVDISDGLVMDLKHLCQASCQKAFVNLSKIPLSQAAQEVLESVGESNRLDLLKEMITGGDDYELLLSIAPDKSEDAIFSAETHGFSLYPLGLLGFCEEGENPSQLVTIIDHNAEKVYFNREGYEHSW